MTAPLPERVRECLTCEELHPAKCFACVARDNAAATIAALRAENARLTSEVERLRKQLDEAEHSAALGCESPPQGCDCPGCSLAREDSALAALDTAGGDR